MELLKPLASLTVDDALRASIQRFVSRLSPYIDWREFGAIPGRGLARRKLRTALSLLPRPGRASYRFLERSPAQAALIERLARRRGPASALVFRFLCLSEIVSEQELLTVLEPKEIEEWQAAGLLLRGDGRIALSVRIIPYGDRYYVTDSIQVAAHREALGLQPVYLAMETQRQIEYIRRRLRGTRLERSLEVGCGTGIASLEIADAVKFREGADLHERSVAYARVNARLRNDADARFYESNLLAAARGPYDLIFFNPFRPTLEALDFVLRFFDQSLERLSPMGRLLFVLHAEVYDGREPVLGALAAELARRGLGIHRRIIASLFGASGEVQSISILWIERDPQRVAAGPAIVEEYGWPYFVWRLRRLYTRLR